MRDWHTHILPEMDDGSASVEESIEMLALEAAQGVDEVVLTPHFYAHREDAAQFLRRREESFQKLMAGLSGPGPVSGQSPEARGQGTISGPGPRLFLGAEVYFFDGLYKLPGEYIDALCFGKRRYLLIEMPFASWTKHELDVVRMTALRQQITPLIAHVDRYLGYKGNIKLLPEFADMGAVFQINVESVVKGFSGRHVRRVIDQYGAVYGTDCHNLTNRRPEWPDSRP